ncbi:MAG: hypothetical protein JRH20_20105 [Deltaproteobacteria bacterium]|nr:hypothetical protein [Deltaproteobacteria bacterium]
MASAQSGPELVAQPSTTLSEASREVLLNAAIMAPTPDNSQPWIFKLIEEGFELWLDPQRLGMFFDISNLCTAMAAGALIENITVQAAALGLATHYVLHPGHAEKIASFRFEPAVGTQWGSLGPSCIYRRCTDRELYDRSRALSDDAVARLRACITAQDAYGCQIYTGAACRRAIGLMTTIDALRFSHERVHKDFYRQLRFGEAAANTRDGLAERTLGLGRLLTAALRLMRPWWLSRALNVLGLNVLSALRATWLPCRSAPCLVALTHHGPCDYVEAGRVMQRFWLHATELGISAQPFGALTFFLARLHLAAGEGFSACQVAALHRVEAGFAEITPEFKSGRDQIIMIFRLGYAPKAPARSYRRPLADFVATLPEEAR